MFKVLFGDIYNGRLLRLPYLGYSLLLVALMIGFGLAVVLAIGVGEHLIGGDLQQAQDKLREWFTLPAMILFGLVTVLFVFSGANIMAKRLRDTGLPGWWLVLAITVLTGAVSYVISNEVSSGLHTLIWVVLLLIPGNAFTRGA